MQLLEDERSSELESISALVRDAQAGDRDAFGQLVERFERTVHGMALRKLGNHAEAQELAQEVFVQALRKIGQLRDPACFGGWLRSITARMAINRITRGGPMIATEPETLEATCVDSVTPLQSALAAERRRQVHDILGRMRALDRDTLLAFYMQGQSLLQMSDSFDSPVGTIKRRLHVARKRFAAAMEEQEALTAV